MKTTIDIPEALYKQAKICAVERGTTLREVMVGALERELHTDAAVSEPRVSYWSQRTLLPDYAAALKAGAFASGPDVTAIVSEDRSSREESLL